MTAKDVKAFTFFPWKAYDKLIIGAAEGFLRSEDLPSEAREVVELGLQYLREGLARLNPDDREPAWLMMVGTLFIDSRVNLSEVAIKYIDNERARKMRDDRASAPEEKALLEAIVAERGDGPAEHPSKEADAIRKNVNTRLESDGFPPVKVDVIYRRLKKFPRS